MSQRAGAFHRHEVGKVLHHRALVFRVEEVVGSGKRYEVFAVLTERHLRQSHVEVGTVIRGDEEVRMRRYVRLSCVMRLQELLVKETLQEISCFVAGCAHECRYVNLVVILATIIIDPGGLLS